MHHSPSRSWPDCVAFNIRFDITHNCDASSLRSFVRTEPWSRCSELKAIKSSSVQGVICLQGAAVGFIHNFRLSVAPVNADASAEAAEVGRLTIRFAFTVVLFAICALCFIGYLISLSREPFPVIVFWASFLGGLAVILGQTVRWNMTPRRSLIILGEIVCLSLLAQLIFVIPIRSGIFGRDAFFDLYSMQTINSTGWPVPEQRRIAHECPSFVPKR